MFWIKKNKEGTKKAVRKIEGPLWGYMVKKGVVVDVLQNLRYVFAEAEMEGKPLFHIRIFDPARVSAAGTAVEDFRALDDYPEQILYEGFVDRLEQPTRIDIQKRSNP